MAISTYSTHHPTAGDTSGTSSSLYDVLDLILEKGLVIDAFVRVSLVGIELLDNLLDAVHSTSDVGVFCHA